jgi:hypothetical protein
VDLVLDLGTATASFTLQGGLISSQLSTPTAPTLTTSGTAGSTTYGYKVTALDGTGETLASSETTIATGNATLTGTNRINISWNSVGGAIQYKIYRTTSAGTPSSTGLISTVAGSVTTISDTGLAASGSTPVANTTGNATIAGTIQGSGLTITNGATIGTTLQVTGTSTLTGGATIRGVTIDNATATDDRILIAVTSNASAARFDGTITNADLTAARTWTLPDESGVVCIVGSTSCLSGAGFVQFAQATVQTDSSTNNSIFINKTGASGNIIDLQKSGVDLFIVNSTGAIQIGSTGNGITLAGSGGVTTGPFTLNGTARNTKKIILTPEYAGAVLNASSDASCSGANNGTMTSGFDATGRVSYYEWVSAAASTNCYNVIVQVPLPSDWDGWATAPTLQVRNSSGTNSTSVYAQIIRSDGTTDTGYSTYQAISSGTSWTTPSLPSLNGSGYAADGYMTVKIRMSSPNTTTTVDVGNLILTYYSRF